MGPPTEDTFDVIGALRQRWWVAALVTLACLAAAGAYVFTAQKEYSSQEQLFVGFESAVTSNLANAAQGGQFTVQRVQSYVDIAASPLITRPVIQQLGLNVTPAALASKITVSAPANTVLLDIGVTDSSAVRAQAIARAVGAQFAQAITDLERPSNSSRSPVKVSVSNPASLSTAPTSPRTGRTLGLALILGLLVGCGGAILLGRLDTRVRTPEQAAAIAGVNLLGVIPFEVGIRGRGASATDLAARVSEPVRQLRTNLRFLSLNRRPDVLVVSSALPGEGKTTVTICLATALASAGTRVAVVEGDLRRPTIRERLDLVGDGAGLSGALAGSGSVLPEMLPWPGDERLHILPAGIHPPNPSELLSSDRMGQIISELRATYEMVIIDAPPLLPVTDGAILASRSDGILLVAHVPRVRRRELRQAVQSLARVEARCLGLVANQVKTGASTEKYGYDYKYTSNGRSNEDLASAAPSGNPAGDAS